ncbi:hypothetical protein EMIT0196MI5_40259 [Pseudomonas sp. IT-196MI5]
MSIAGNEDFIAAKSFGLMRFTIRYHWSSALAACGHFSLASQIRFSENTRMQHPYRILLWMS